MTKLYFFIKRRWVASIIFFIIFFLATYSLIDKRELLYKAEASIIFIGEAGSFTPELEARRVREESFLVKISNLAGAPDAATMKKDLKLSFKDDNTLLVSYISTDPVLARDVVNTALSLFTDERSGKVEALKREEVSKLEAFSGKIEAFGKDQSSLQKRLRDFKAKNIDSDRRRGGLQKQIERLKLQRQELLKLFTEMHPDIVNISARIDVLQPQLEEIPDNSAVYDEIDVEIKDKAAVLKLKEQEYRQLYAAYKEKGEPWHAEIKEDALLPSHPLGKPKNWYYGWALLAAFLGSIFCSAIMELIDKRAYTKKEVEENLKLPVIVELDKTVIVKKRKRRRPPIKNALLFDYKDNSLMVKRFEQLYTFLKVETFKSDIDKKAILIGSAETSAGKTFIASNLALAAAKNGEKVLLIDTNLRHPGVDAIFNFEDGTEGLSDILRGSIKYKDAIRNLTDLLLTGRLKLKEEEIRSLDNLKILLAGSRVDNPLGLLKTKELSELFKELSQAYGMLVIDSSAIKSYPDTLNIIRSVDSVLLATRKGRSSYPSLQGVVSQVEKINGPLTGVIFSRV